LNLKDGKREVYVNGFLSLPADIQFKGYESIAGFQDVKFFVQVMQSNMITFRQRS
jgi:tRNA U34 5-carboxymethylaminomethyl modifying enzyme MnmG/GidA